MCGPEPRQIPTSAQGALTAALKKGDAAAVNSLKSTYPPQDLIRLKDEFLSGLTRRYLAGEAAFCEITAAAQACSALFDASLPPKVCVGAVQGNESGTGRDYMMMLLTAWGVPALDLGLNAGPGVFLEAIREHDLGAAVCAIFSDRDLESVGELHRRAESEGLRDSFLLAVCGAEHGSYGAEDFRLDCPEHRAAAVAEWVAHRWK
ncbi:MAG: hypothetical protein IJR97_08245 [Clostridia bacterium]|nr:hypothetical protein [Clostridia bacterium]